MPIDAAQLRDCEELAMALADYSVTEIRGRRVLAEERSTKAGPSDWVTVVDIGIEHHVRQELLAAFPGHTIVGEELGGIANFAAGTPLWYVDPVDGTTNFVHGLPWSSFSLALADDEGLVLRRGRRPPPWRSVPCCVRGAARGLIMSWSAAPPGPILWEV